MKKLLLLVAGVSVAAPAGLAAQSLDDLATYASLTRTPVGALGPMLTDVLLDRIQNGPSLALRYGFLRSGFFNERTNAMAATAIFPITLGSSISLTGGMLLNDETIAPGISNSITRFMAGLAGDIRLVGATVGEGPAAPLWTVTLVGEAGYSDRSPGSFWSGYFGLPFTLVTQGEGIQFVPFITPGFGFANASGNGDTFGGAAFMLGGGLGVYKKDSGIQANLGAQHVFKDKSEWMIGANIIFGSR